MLKYGNPPYLECSSKGDKRFSAFYARIRSRNNRSIEDIYQATKVFEDGLTNLDWRQAKGKLPVNIEEVKKLYSQLWDEYIQENSELLEVLKNVSGISDMFGQPGHQCQATELFRIKNNHTQDKLWYE